MYGVIVPVIPFAIQYRAGVPADSVQRWVSVLLAVYGAALLVGAPICGVLADRSTSRRGPLLCGLAVLAGSTVMLCLGRSIALLVVGRMLQGGSASVVWVVGLALMSDSVGENEAGKAMGYVTLSYSLGILVAPLLGGVVYARAGYYAVFGMIFAVIGLDIILRLLLIEKKIASKWLPAEAVTEGVRAKEDDSEKNIPLTDIERTGPGGQFADQNDGRIQIAPASGKSKLPPIILLLKSKRMLAAFWGNLVMAAVYGGFDTTLPLYVNKVFGWDSLGAGLIFLALVTPSFAGPVIGHFTDKYGPRWIAATGLVLALPFFVLLRLVDHDSVRQIVLLCALLAGIGGSSALVMTPLMTEFSSVCDAKERKQPGVFGPRGAYAQSYGIFNMAWAAGSLIGPLWAAGVVQTAGWKTMAWTLGLLCAVSVVPVVLYSGGQITKRKEQS